jgi:ribonuclease HI
MEYHGLIERLHWALTLKLKTLVIKGDSKLAIRQMKGKYAVDSSNLRPLHRKVREMLSKANAEGLEVEFRRITRDQKTVSDRLANCAIEVRENGTTFSGDDVNGHCRRTQYWKVCILRRERVRETEYEEGNK